MEIYLVGGAVRDQLLGRPIVERDWVVVGATPEEMLAKGFRPVGKDFPVFLHPETHEEYALARTERKVAKGYSGFEFHAAPDVSLNEDLKRRDLTINAIAQTAAVELIDPYHGQQDLKNKILRHVSAAFAEDPVRILRLARFAARFPDFNIHPNTLLLMQQMVSAGEVDALVSERVWQEFERALTEISPERFFTVLQQCGAINILFPEIVAVPQAQSALHNAAIRNMSADIRFAAMFAFIELPQAEKLFARYRIPADYRELAVLIIKFYKSYCLVETLSAGDLLILIEKIDAFRRPERFEKFLLACEVNCTTSSEKIFKQSERLRKAYLAAAQVSPQQLLKQGLVGKAIAEALHQLRLKAIEQINAKP